MNDDQKRTIIAFLIIIGLLFLWSIISRPKQVPSSQGVLPDTTKPTLELTEPQIILTDTIVIDKEKFKVVLTSTGAAVKSFFLKEYNIDIVPADRYLFISSFNNSDSILNFAYRLAGDSVVFTHKMGGDLITISYIFNSDNGFRLVSAIPSPWLQTLSLKSGIRVTEFKNKGEDLRYFNVYLKRDKVENVTKMIKDRLEWTDHWEWLGLRNKYFMLVINNLASIAKTNLYKLAERVAPATKISYTGLHQAGFGCYPFAGGAANRYGVELISHTDFDITVLLLPVKGRELAKYEKDYEKVISGGLLAPIARLILLIFNLFYAIFKNYGIAIIIFAILLKLLFFPLSKQMIISQRKMQMLQPELKKIQQKYKNNAQALNQEMMHLYKTYKVNPFSGCLPLLIQFPIFVALYEALSTAIEFRQASFVLWLTDLSLKDPYYVLPIGMGILMLFQSLLTTIDPRQKFMVILMPLLMIIFFLNLPSGLQLYWFTYNILTLVEHYIAKT